MKRTRQQNGTIVRIGGRWYVRYWQRRNDSGTIVRKRATHLLGDVAPRSKKPDANIKQAAEEYMRSINGSSLPAERVVTMGDFVGSVTKTLTETLEEGVYLPWVNKHKRPSTLKGYRDIWEYHLKARCERTLLRDVKTYDVQHWLEQIASEDGLGKRSLHHVKFFLSGVFRHAVQQNYLDSSRANPVTLATVPEAHQGEETYAYSLEEVKNMLARVPEPAATVIAVAALAGLRRGEIRGLEWPDYTPATSKTLATMQIQRSIWNGITTAPKTEKSKAVIPVIGPLAEMLDAHRLRSGNPSTGPIFRNSLEKPQDMDGLYRTVIKEVKGISWHGWHGFRRGLASNLNRLGVDDSVIQAILRHSSIQTTQTHYIKTTRVDVTNAMQQFEVALRDTLGTPEQQGDTVPVSVN